MERNFNHPVAAFRGRSLLNWGNTMSRLNKDTRKKIIENAVSSSRIPQARKDLIPRAAALAEKIRVDLLGGEDVAQELDKYLEKVKALPLGPIKPGWAKEFKFTKRPCSYAKVGSYNIRLGFNGEVYNTEYEANGLPGRTYLIYSGQDTYKNFPCGNEGKYHPESAIGSELLFIIDTIKELNSEEEILRARVSEVVHSTGSIKKLLEVWPNAKDLLPKIEAAALHAPAVIDTASLDQLIGLPK